MPRIKSRFARIEPRMDAWTMRIWFLIFVSTGRLVEGAATRTYLDKSNTVEEEILISKPYMHKVNTNDNKTYILCRC